MKTTFIRESLAAVAAIAAITATTSSASALTYGATRGTTSDKNFSNWAELSLGGVVNNSAATKDWLIPVNTRHESCSSGSCLVYAVYRGSASASGCVRGYWLTDLGAIAAQIGPVCNTANMASRLIGGSNQVPSGVDTLLIVANLPSTGAIMSVTVDGNAGTPAHGVGAIHGHTASFSTSNWAEYGVGGIRNKAATAREWLISVPRPAAAGATFGGGAGGNSCAIAYGVGFDGSMQSASDQICQSTFEFESLGSPSGESVLYVINLAAASSSGANDGGFISTVRY
jgi:hypothetical protein